MEFHFRRHFRLRPKMKNAFRSASSMHIGLEMQSLGLGLEYITAFQTSRRKQQLCRVKYLRMLSRRQSHSAYVN